MGFFSLFKRVIGILFAKGNAAVSEAEEANIKELLEVRIKKANEDLSRAQAGVAAAFGQFTLCEAAYKKAVEEETQLVARFKALDRAKSPQANDAALAVQRKRNDVAAAKARMDTASDVAKTSQRTLEAARKAQEQNIAKARQNANEIASNRALANALETANGLVSETAGNAAEFQNYARMAEEANAKQKGRILASQGQLASNGLLENAETEAILAEDAAASLRAELNTPPQKQASSGVSAAAMEEPRKM